jgi:geranylgeranyl pyrophosphate synthase
MNDLSVFFADVSRSVDATLNALIPSAEMDPRRLHEAIRWSIFGGGKRFRPALLIAAGRTFRAKNEALMNTAAAVEMIHTYSLIHDDLPAMDDDDLRRGRETCHRKFDESTAILAGDALQALAFQTIADDMHLTADIRLTLVAGLGGAAAEMVAGQQLDLEAEGRELTIEQIEQIHARKTGALIRFSAMAGAIIGDADDKEAQAISDFGSKLGLLFQITDDLLDVTRTTQELGKTAGKDASAYKATYPVFYGIEATGQLAHDVHAQAIKCLGTIDRPTDLLREIADFILTRRS